MDYKKWHDETLERIKAAFPEHMHKDFVNEITEGWVFWPVDNRGFLPGHKLEEIGKLLTELNKPLMDDYNEQLEKIMPPEKEKVLQVRDWIFESLKAIEDAGGHGRIVLAMMDDDLIFTMIQNGLHIVYKGP